MASLERWAKLCGELQYSAELQASGQKMLEHLHSLKDRVGELQTEASVKGQLASTAYFASLETGERPVPIMQLVAHLSLSMKEFFSHAEEQHALLSPGTTTPEALKQLKAQYLVSTVAYKKYQHYYGLLFPDGFAGKDAELQDASFKLGWLTYVLAKCSILGQRGDLMSAYHLLACIFQLVLAHLPESARTAGSFWPRLAAEVPFESFPLPAEAQGTLCSLLKAQTDEMVKLQGGVASFVIELKGLLNLGDGAGGPSGLGGLLRADTLDHTLAVVTAQYEKTWSERSQLDDRSFLTPPPAPGAAAAAASMPSVPSSPCKPSPSAEQQLLTPLRKAPERISAAVAGTPISSQLESVSWLKEAVHQTRSLEPGAELLSYFGQCDPNPADGIHDRLKRLTGSVQRYLEASELSCDITERCGLARRLYYKMLLTFLQAEEKRLGQSNFTALLTNESFHCSLFACCMEAVFATYSMCDVAFPKILELLELQAFDFCKVISFPRAPPPPRATRPHRRHTPSSYGNHLPHMAFDVAAR